MKMRSRPSLRCLGKQNLAPLFISSYRMHQVSTRHTRQRPSSPLPPQHGPQPLLPPPRPSHGRMRLESRRLHRPPLPPHRHDRRADALWRHVRALGLLGRLASVLSKSLLTYPDSWWFQGLIFTGIWVIGHEVRPGFVFVFPLPACLLFSSFPSPSLLFAKLTSTSQSHQCGHGAFSDYKLLNDVVGYVSLWLPGLLVPL